jgi:hypothetical protein
MLKSDQYEHIRIAHRVHSEAISDIARRTGHSRVTIRKALLDRITATLRGSSNRTRFSARTC